MFSKFLTPLFTRSSLPRARGRWDRRGTMSRQLQLQCLEHRLALSRAPAIVTRAPTAGQGRCGVPSARSSVERPLSSPIPSIRSR